MYRTSVSFIYKTRHTFDFECVPFHFNTKKRQEIILPFYIFRMGIGI